MKKKITRFLMLLVLFSISSNAMAQTWEVVALSDIKATDIVLIVDATSACAMPNNKGTGSAPTAIAVTLSADKSSVTAGVTDALKWNVSGNATDGYTFYPNGQTATWLYCTATNNGVRVGTNAAKVFEEHKDGSNKVYLKHTGTGRFVGVYNKQDWRCYTSSTVANIKNVDTKFYKYVSAPAVEAPVFSPAETGFTGSSLTVTLSCSTDGATIKYTTDGSVPSASTGNNYVAGGFTISATTTVKAIAIKGDDASEVVTKTYSKVAEAPVFTSASQVFTGSSFAVEITAESGAAIYYTTDGTTPTATDGTLYVVGGFSVSATTTVKAIAVLGGLSSEVVEATYTKAYSIAEAKVLYVDADVDNVVIDLTGCQVSGQYGGNRTFIQDANSGILLYGTAAAYEAGTTFTGGTVKGTITLYGALIELTSPTFADVTTTTGTLTPITGVSITDITSSFSTYESRCLSLSSLYFTSTSYSQSMDVKDADDNTFVLYDGCEVMKSSTFPTTTDEFTITGVITSYTKSGTTTYQIIPVAASGISTTAKAVAPTFSPAGGATDVDAVEATSVNVAAASTTTISYSVNDGTATELAAGESADIAIEMLGTTKITATAKRDFYADNSMTYYYKYDLSVTKYDVEFFVNGVKYGSTLQVAEDSPIGTGMPAAPTAPAGFTFMGWTTAANYMSATTAPAYFDDATDVTANTQLYAVFAEAGYFLLEEALTDYSGEYLIATDATTFMEGASATPGASGIKANPGDNLKGKMVSASWGDQHNFKIIAVEGGYVLQTTSATPTYYYTTGKSSNSSSENLTFAIENKLSVSVANDGKATISNTRILMYNTDGFFRFYTTIGSNGAIYLYKKSAQNYTTRYKEVTIGITGFATYFDNVALAVPTGVKAHYCTIAEEEGTNVVYSYSLHSVIPANTGVLLKGEPATYCFAYTPLVGTDDLSQNCLIGYDTDTEVTGSAATYGYYALGAVSGIVGFYIPSTSTSDDTPFGTFTAKANKAYLQVPGDKALAQSLRIALDDDNEPTGIGHTLVNSTTESDVVYDLMGRRVENPTRGLYIVNGKKLFIK